MRVSIRLLIYIFAGVILVGLVCAPLLLIWSVADIFGPGGFADQLLNIFAEGLFFILFVVPIFGIGAVLMWQPRDETKKKGRESAAPQRYGLFKALGGACLVWFAYLLFREQLTTPPPFPTSREAAQADGD